MKLLFLFTIFLVCKSIYSTDSGKLSHLMLCFSEYCINVKLGLDHVKEYHVIICTMALSFVIELNKNQGVAFLRSLKYYDIFQKLVTFN